MDDAGDQIGTRLLDQKREMTMNPNIVYILVDDTGYGDVWCLNESSKVRTCQQDTCSVAQRLAPTYHQREGARAKAG